jgi:hypothetical protein
MRMWGPPSAGRHVSSAQRSLLRLCALALMTHVTLGAQGPPSARAQAPRDITGYWVAVVSEDWHWRMVTPRKGDVTSLPLNAEGRRVANAWDPSREKPADACKPFGAAAIMRVPGRLHITWADDATLRIDTDAGQQTARWPRAAGA